MRAVTFSSLGLLLAASLACDRSNVASPTAPPPLAPPPALAQIAGAWDGTLTVTDVNREDHCVARYFEQAVGAPQETSMRVGWSDGDQFVSINFDPESEGYPLGCTFLGSLSGQRLTVTEKTDGLCGGPNGHWPHPRVFVTCPSGRSYEMFVRNSTLEGTFDEALRNFEGTRESKLRATHGSETINFVLQETVRLTKQ